MKFSIIICGKNEVLNLDACLTACINLSYPKEEFEVLYVDNNSTDGSLSVAKKYPIKTIRDESYKLSEVRNRGIRESVGEVIIFFDADTVVDKNYLLVAEEVIKPEAVGCVTGRVLPIHSTWVSNYLGVSLFESYPRYKKGRKVFSAPCCDFVIKRSVINKIGFFRVDFSSGLNVARFFEDKELSFRIRKAGYKILYDPRMRIHHDSTHSFKKLVNIWIQGAVGRVGLIQADMKDVYTQLFRYNIALLYFLLCLIGLAINPIFGYFLVSFAVAVQLFLCLKSYIDNGMFFSNFFVKSWMDPLSILVIDTSVFYFRFIKPIFTK